MCAKLKVIVNNELSGDEQGKDDLRQDAVMQQVFSVVNNLLTKNAETRRRNLAVRTYKVLLGTTGTVHRRS